MLLVLILQSLVGRWSLLLHERWEVRLRGRRVEEVRLLAVLGICELMALVIFVWIMFVEDLAYSDLDQIVQNTIILLQVIMFHR